MYHRSRDYNPKKIFLKKLLVEKMDHNSAVADSHFSNIYGIHILPYLVTWLTQNIYSFWSRYHAISTWWYSFVSIFSITLHHLSSFNCYVYHLQFSLNYKRSSGVNNGWRWQRATVVWAMTEPATEATPCGRRRWRWRRNKNGGGTNKREQDW